MTKAKNLAISILLSWLIIFIVFFEIKLSPDKTRYALASKRIGGGYSVTVNDCPTFASGSNLKEMRFSYDNKYLLVKGRHKGNNNFAVFVIKKEFIHNIDEYIESACQLDDTRMLWYQQGEELSLDFICWHQEYNFLKFNYTIVHSDNSTSEGFLWFDYENGKVLSVNSEI